MKLTKQEIEEELAHKRQVVSALVRRRRPLELQAAQKGLSTPPETLTEMSTLTEQIREYEDQIASLETLAAEGQISIVEAEYRVMLAKAWDTPRGRPTLAGASELELARLKMGLALDKAQHVEDEVRKALAEEAFSNLDTHFLDSLPRLPEPKVPEPKASNQNSQNGRFAIGDALISFGGEQQIGDVTINNIVGSYQESPYDTALRFIGRAIRLDDSTALQLFLIIIPQSLRLDMEVFGRQLITANRVWNYQEDKEVFEWFLNNLDQMLAQQ